jgi:TetR/AcrR family transcriptional repressor of nem operon
MSKAAATREMILQKSFELIYRKGFQATSIDEIIATTMVTKGAFFYHFKTKDQMGLEMITEILYPGMYEVMIKPLEADGNPIEQIYTVMETLLMNNDFFITEFGCPAINLIEEMAPVSDAFVKALQKLVAQWQDGIAASIIRAQAKKEISPNVSPQEVAMFVTTGYIGIRAMGKLQGKSCYKTFLKGFKTYLNHL